MIASKYRIGSGVGVSKSPLVAFDRALIDAGVGNYNLVRLSSILPAGCEEADRIDLKEGSLLPTAYATISSSKKGDSLVSVIGVGIPKDKNNVGVIMEYSAINQSREDAFGVLHAMIQEAFDVRGWDLDCIKDVSACTIVEKDGETRTTFACIAEW